MSQNGGCLRKVVTWAVVVVLVVVVLKSCGIDFTPFGSSGCDAASAAEPTAYAESNDCEDLKQAALDPAWAARQQDTSELRNGRVTTGLFFDSSPDGHIALSSGRDDLSDQAASLLEDAGYDDPDPNPATHVEVKIAAKMNDEGTPFGVLVINNSFVCGGCASVVRILLPEGTTLWIWTKGARQVLAIKGRG